MFEFYDADRLPPRDIYIMDSEISRDVLILTKDDEWLVGYYFYPTKCSELEGWRAAYVGRIEKDEIECWCFLPDVNDVNNAIKNFKEQR